MEGSFTPETEAAAAQQPAPVVEYESASPSGGEALQPDNSPLLDPNSEILGGVKPLPAAGAPVSSSEQLLDPNDPLVANESKFSYQVSKKNLDQNIKKLQEQLDNGEITKQQFESQKITLQARHFGDLARVLDPEAVAQGREARFSKVFTFTDDENIDTLLERMPFLRGIKPSELTKVKDAFGAAHEKASQEIFQEFVQKMGQTEADPTQPFSEEFQVNVSEFLKDSFHFTEEQSAEITNLNKLLEVFKSEIPFEDIVARYLIDRQSSDEKDDDQNADNSLVKDPPQENNAIKKEKTKSEQFLQWLAAKNSKIDNISAAMDLFGPMDWLDTVFATRGSDHLKAHFTNEFDSGYEEKTERTGTTLQFLEKVLEKEESAKVFLGHLLIEKPETVLEQDVHGKIYQKFGIKEENDNAKRQEKIAEVKSHYLRTFQLTIDDLNLHEYRGRFNSLEDISLSEEVNAYLINQVRKYQK